MEEEERIIEDIDVIRSEFINNEDFLNTREKIDEHGKRAKLAWCQNNGGGAGFAAFKGGF